MARLWPPIFLGIVTVLAILFLTSDDDVDFEDIFEVRAVYDSGHITIEFLDKSGKTNSVTLEILGMAESYQKSFDASSFEEIVEFPGPPTYGWKVHPIIFDINHAELGHIQIKTEVHSPGEGEPPVIISRP